MTEREKFEIALANVGLTHISLLFNGERYVDNAIDNMWWAWQAAKSALLTLPDRMDYELHGDSVISNPFTDGYNQCLSDVIAMNEE